MLPTMYEADVCPLVMMLGCAASFMFTDDDPPPSRLIASVIIVPGGSCNGAINAGFTSIDDKSIKSIPVAPPAGSGAGPAKLPRPRNVKNKTSPLLVVAITERGFGFNA